MGNNISTCMPKRYNISHGLHYHMDQAGGVMYLWPFFGKKGQRYKSMKMVQIAVTEINSNQKLLVIWLVVTF